jgi:hypothetical protein
VRRGLEENYLAQTFAYNGMQFDQRIDRFTKSSVKAENAAAADWHELHITAVRDSFNVSLRQCFASRKPLKRQGSCANTSRPENGRKNGRGAD